MPDDKNLYKEKAKDGFNRQATQFDFSRDGEHARTVYPHALEKLHLFPYHSVLDVGCGTGAVLLTLVEQDQGDLTLAGIDLSPEMVNIAQKKMKGRADLRVGDAEQLPWPDNSFDVVLCLDSFHHYPHPERALLEMRRVAKASGQLILGDFWAPSPLRQLMNLFIRFSKDGDVHVYSESEVCTLLKGCGFIEIQWELVNKNVYIVTATIG